MRRIYVIDWKSSKAFYPEMSWQLAAYRHAAKSMEIIDGDADVGTGILRLDKETGLPEFHDCTDTADRDLLKFLAITNFFNLAFPYKEPKRKSKFDSSRFYDIDGEMYPSVTTILGCLDKPALKQWASNCAVEYIRDNLDRLTDNLDSVLKEASTAYAKHSKKATDTGTLVHDAIEAYLSKSGKHDDILASDDKAQNAFLAFLEWEKKVELEPLHLEIQIQNKTHRYAGRCDFIGYINVEGK